MSTVSIAGRAGRAGRAGASELLDRFRKGIVTSGELVVLGYESVKAAAVDIVEAGEMVVVNLF